MGSKPEPDRNRDRSFNATILSTLMALAVCGGWFAATEANRSKLETATNPPVANASPPVDRLPRHSNSPLPLRQPTPRSTPQPPIFPTLGFPSPTSQPSQGSLTPSRGFANVPIQLMPGIPTRVATWQEKNIRGIYIGRNQMANKADEKSVRRLVRFYKSQGLNTLIVGVWGNACSLYESQVTQRMFGYKTCPKQFNKRWLEWTIDESHKQGMQVHAFFEKGIKLDRNSPIFQLAIDKQWVVPGVDRSAPTTDHYALDIRLPEVTGLYRDILAEFVKKYPKIDAVQWDDYLGYYKGLPTTEDRSFILTQFARELFTTVKINNPNVKFDICHHNPYWAKQHYAADWQQWQFDRAFIQVYNDPSFAADLNYAEYHEGVAISERQLPALETIVANPRLKSILLFSLDGTPEKLAAKVHKILKE